MTLILETKRLRLRTWTIDDAESAFELWGNSDVMKFVGKPFASVEVARRALQNAIVAQEKHGVSLWAVVEKSSRTVIGCCGFHPHETGLELAYHFVPSTWGNGYATEASRACLKYGFEKLDAAKIVAFTHTENIGSYRVLEKLGMKYKGIVENEGEKERLYELNSEEQ
jgi:ribosomal-protein-alanine N-acetyltransferase